MKKILMFLFIVGMANMFISMRNPGSASAETFPVVERETVVSDMPTASDDEYETTETQSDEWSDDYETAPVPEIEFTGEDFLGDWVTANGCSDIRFYKYNGQIYYAAYYDGVYYEGFAIAYPTHGAIYCMDGYSNDGNVAIAFYYGYNNDTIMYDQVYGTEYYLKTSY